MQVVTCNTLGNTYYVGKDDLLEEAQVLHDQMIAKDPFFAAKALVYGRNEGYMRLQPTLGLAKLLSADSPKAKEAASAVFDRVMLIPSDLQDLFTILAGMGRGQGGRRVKALTAKWLNEKLSPYWAIKYNGRGRGYSLGDLVATCHPKPKDTVQNALFQYVMGKENVDFLGVERLGQIAGYELLKAATTDVERIALIGEHRLPHEVVTSAVSEPSDAVWRVLGPTMPIKALLRNLVTLHRHHALERKAVEAVLTNPERIAKSRILPYEFLKAFKKVVDEGLPGWLHDALRIAVELSFVNLPDIAGRTLFGLDVSPSMKGEMLMECGMFGFALYKKSEDATMRCFGGSQYDPQPSKMDSIITQASRLRHVDWTATSLPLLEALNVPQFYDNHIVITDGEQNQGPEFNGVVKAYRQKINPKLKVFVVDLSPYRNSLAPMHDKDSHYIYGWSDRVLAYIGLASKAGPSQVDAVRSIPV